MLFFSSYSLTAPTTSYANSGGTGNRTALFTISSSVTWAAGTTSNLFDGAFTSNDADSVDPPNTTINNGDYIRWQSASRKYIDEIKIYQSNAASEGNWKVQGSDDASTWTDLASFTWNQVTQTVTLTSVPPQGFFYYQLVENDTGISWSLVPWIQEIECKIADGAT